MKKLALLFCSFLVAISCQSKPEPESYYLTHTTILDVTNGDLIPNMTIVITDSIISAIGPSNEIKTSHNDKVINCEGKFIVPGLWDMHVHLGNATASSLPLFIVNGITGVRDMGTKSFDSIVHWRAHIRSGQTAGPRIVSSGPILNGGLELPDFQIAVNTAEEAKSKVDSLAGIGVDFIKVHSGLTRETYYAIAGECKRLGIPFAGHVPTSNTNLGVTGEEAAEAGQRSLEHMLGIPFARDTIKAFQNMYPTEESLDRLYAVLLENGTYVTPTLSVYAIPADYEAISQKQDSLVKYISPGLLSFWKGQTTDWADRDKWFMNWLLKARMNMVPALKDAGIPILAGTDTGFPYVLPGFGLQTELEYMVDSGLSPLEALQSATISPANFFGKKDILGTVKKGQLADLVILNADPSKKIHNLRSIQMVIVNGTLFDRRALDDQLLEVSKQVKKSR